MRTRVTLPTMIIGVLAAVAAATVITVLTKPSTVLAQGSTQISGIAFFAEHECTDMEGEGSDFALRMTGDLEGCHYVFVEDSACSPSGTYREIGTEIFVGHYNGALGTFSTTYQFTAKYDDCPALIGEIFGRCQHPLIANSGTGVFEGFTGRLDFKDDVEEGNFPYRGHLQR